MCYVFKYAQKYTNIIFLPLPSLYKTEMISPFRFHSLSLTPFFSRTTEQISNKLGTKHPWVLGIQVCSNEEFRLFPRGDNYKKRKYYADLKKSFSPEPLGQFQPNLAKSKPLGKEDLS